MSSPARVRALLSAYLTGQGAGSLWTALATPAVLSAALAALIRGELPPFAYALVFLSASVLFVAIPLLGDLGHLLRADAAEHWIGAQPTTERELRAARSACLVLVLFGLALGPLLPAVLLAPEALDWSARVALVPAGFGAILILAATLLCLQTLLAGRAESLFVGLQTLLVAGVFLALVLGVRELPRLVPLESFEPGSALALLPTAWFAAPFGAVASPALLAAPVAASLAALALLLALPRPRVPAHGTRPTALERLLEPARRLASRLWVRADERGPFDLVYDALPREREVVLRTYPMMGIPLAFLLAAASGVPTEEREALLALLLFTPGLYLPILLTHVCASESSGAAWLHIASPVSEGAVANGTIKALAVRFLLPLYAVLFALAWNGAGLEVALRLALPGGLVSLLVLRWLYGSTVTEPPLSVAPEEVRSRLDLGGNLMLLAVLLTIAGVAAARFLQLPLALGLALVLAGAEAAGGRALRRRLG